MNYGPAVKRLIKDLSRAGIAAATAERIVPAWWDERAEQVDDAVLELKVRFARAFSLDVDALISNGKVQFEIPGSIRFKRARRVADQAKVNPFVAFACSVAKATVAASDHLPPFVSVPEAAKVRAAIFATNPTLKWLTLPALLDLCWNLGIPVVHLAGVRFAEKGFDGLTVHCDGRPVIVLARDEKTPAWQLFIVAHELAHIALGHVRPDEIIVDEALSPELRAKADLSDPEENAADDYALRLLGGDAWATHGTLAPGLAVDKLVDRAVELGSKTQTDPGHVILRVGRAQGNWPATRTALEYLQRELDRKAGTPYSAVEEVNRTAQDWLDFEGVPEDTCELLRYTLSS